MKVWTFTVPAIASWKRDKITTRGSGGRARARTYRPADDAAAKLLIRSHASRTKPRGWRTDGCYKLTVEYTPADWRRHDADRVLSLVPDALKGIAWDDDHDGQIVEEGVCRASLSDGEVCQLFAARHAETVVRIEWRGMPKRVRVGERMARRAA